MLQPGLRHQLVFCFVLLCFVYFFNSKKLIVSNWNIDPLLRTHDQYMWIYDSYVWNTAEILSKEKRQKK